MDAVGLRGGPVPRAAPAARRRRAARRCCDAASPRCARPSPHEGGARTSRRSTRTRRACRRGSSPAACPRCPGATMLERKLHFEAEQDDLRLLLMREPRGHAAMSGAILQPPTRARRRLGRAVHRGLGLPADVRARDDRRRDRAGRDRDGRGHRARDDRPARHARRARRGARRGARRARDGGDAAQRARRSWPRATRWSRSPGSATLTYDMAFGGNFYAIVDAAAVGLDGRPGARRRARSTRGAGDHGRDRRGRPPGAPGGPADLRLPPRRAARARRATAPTRAPRRRSTRAGSTARRAAPGRARAWRSCTRAASSALGEPFVNESVHRHALHRAASSRRRRSAGRPAVVPGDHRPRVDHRDGPVPARRRATRSRRASRCDGAPDVVVVGAGIVGRLRGARARPRRRCRRGRRARRRVGRGLLLGQRRPARAQPRAADRGARGAPRRARVDGAAGLAVRPQAQAVAGAVAGALPAGVDVGARRRRGGAAARAGPREHRRRSASCAAEGIDGGFDEPRLPDRAHVGRRGRSTRRPRPPRRRADALARGC